MAEGKLYNSKSAVVNICNGIFFLQGKKGLGCWYNVWVAGFLGPSPFNICIKLSLDICKVVAGHRFVW